jgi:23S rRNA U2552 (ribose-2'-O)-methylase RlmE/FtsJ
MYKYKIDKTYDKIPLEINIETVPINDKGVGEVLSINLDSYYKINRAKNRITEINSNQWDEVKKITNPYEFIHTFNSKTKTIDSRSIALYKPLSRSFFKMIEIISEFSSFLEKQDCSFLEKQDLGNPARKCSFLEKQDCSFLEKSRTKKQDCSFLEKSRAKNDDEQIPSYEGSSSEPSQLISGHIAEGPGGFIEAIRYIRKHNKDDLAFGMTLIKYDRSDYKKINVLGWHKSNRFLFNNPEVRILNGEDGTGNIYKIKNIDFFNNEIRINSPLGADIVTGDGGFDFSIDYNYQEQLSCKLIFSQILCALKCQKLEGTFICKFFDLNLYFTSEMLYLLYSSYETIYIYKPFTSRIANSEKYIVCTNFIGIDETLLNNLFNVLENWNKYEGQTINYIFKKIPNDFIDKIKEINIEIIDLQIKSINNTIDIIKTNKILNNKKWYDATVKLQIQKAIQWCKKYNIACNLDK